MILLIYEELLQEKIDENELQQKLSEKQYTLDIQKVPSSNRKFHMNIFPAFSSNDTLSFRISFEKNNIEILNHRKNPYFDEGNELFSILQSFFLSLCSIEDRNLFVFRHCIIDPSEQTNVFQDFFKKEGFKSISSDSSMFLKEVGILDKKDDCFVKELTTGGILKNVENKPDLSSILSFFQSLEPTFRPMKHSHMNSNSFYSYYGHNGILTVQYKQGEFVLCDETISFKAIITEGSISKEDAARFFRTIENKHRLDFVFHAPSFPLETTTLLSNTASKVVSVLQKELSWKEIQLKVKNHEHKEFTFQKYKVFQFQNYYFLIEKSFHEEKLVFYSDNVEDAKTFLRGKFEQSLTSTFHM